MQNDPEPFSRDVFGVEVTEGYGEWFVHVVSGGSETVVSFEIEAQARSFAAGQRIRLESKAR